jgi:hypothetical protein
VCKKVKKRKKRVLTRLLPYKLVTKKFFLKKTVIHGTAYHTDTRLKNLGLIKSPLLVYLTRLRMWL